MAFRALITGISGFVGGFLAEHLLDCGDAVLGTSPRGRWMADSPPAVGDRVELVGWDLAGAAEDDGSWRQPIEAFRPQVIYHLAAISIPADCGQTEPTDRARAVNVEGTRRVLELAAALPDRPRLVVISTSHVYAPVSREAPVVDERAPLGPARAYGKTKLAAEQLVARAVRRHAVDAVVVRAFQHTGPRQSARMMLPEWASQFAATADRPVEVHTRDAWIDLSDVRDVVRAYRLLAEKGESGQVYNVGSGRNLRTGDVLEMLRTLADPHSRRLIVETRPGTTQGPVADTRKLVECTGWQAAIPLDETVADTLAYWRGRARGGEA